MSAFDDDLTDLAGAILDGTPVNWDAARGDPDADAALLDELRILSELTHLHRSLARPDTAREHPALAGLDPSALPRWGHLLLLDRVGGGSFGEVFRAWDTHLEREVALKLIDAGDRTSGPGLEEGRLLARIRHPNVLAVYGAERIGSQIGIWTEFIHGRTLEQILSAEGPLTADAAANFGREICSALSAVHAAGLLHRDVKAQNVMREDGGRIVLMDFGAGAEDEIRHERGRATLAGTPLYVAPELLVGARPTTQSDVYSVGVLLFHLATGAFPVSGQSLEDVAQRHTQNARLALADVRPELPREFTAIVERATNPDPARRFETVSALEAALSAFLTPATPAFSASRRAGHRLGKRGVAVAAALVATGAATGVWLRAYATLPFRQAPAAAKTMTMRRVDLPAMGLMRAGTPSADGRLYANVDVNLNVRVYDLQTGATRQLTNTGDRNENAEFSAISPDGSQVVYSWLRPDDTYELRISSTDHGETRVLLPPGRASQVIPVEWSRDGSEVLCLVRQSATHFQIGLVSVARAELRVIKDLGGNEPQHMTLSVDGRFVAYDYPQDGTSSSARDIFVLNVDGSPARAVIAHPSDDVSPVWTPDGHHLLFLSNRSGTYDAWTADVIDGAVVGEPVIAVHDLGDVTMSGFTSAGALYYWRRSGDMDVFTRTLAAGAAGVPGRVRSGHEGMNSAPAWSADGRFFAYLSRRGIGTPAVQFVITIHELGGSVDREFPVNLKVVSPAALRWSPDGRQILLAGQDHDGGAGAFILNVDSGAVAPAVITHGQSAAGAVRAAHWWADGHSIAYIANGRVIVRELGSSVERVVFDPAAQSQPLRYLENFEPSPDGQSLAISGLLEGTDPNVNVLLVSTIGGLPSELLRTTSPEMLSLQTWTPDSRSILVTRRDTRVKGPHALWRVTLDGAARDTGIRIPGFTQVNRLQIDPAGDRIAYTVDQVGWELWVVEHFLQGPRP